MANFKARARTLEMLGRQQIAGVPTAISELFKNAHDAYADNVEVDYYLSDGLFVMRDDGLGMTRNDFEERWLTLGTESQLGSSRGISPPPKDPNKSERPILGEKGIGRLAIASIGPQVLVLTRAKRDGKSEDLVAALINWTVFELPGVDLEQIVIPIRVFQGGSLPNKTNIGSMIDEIRDNVKILQNQEKITNEDAKKIITQLDQFSVDPTEIDGFLNKLSNLTLTGSGHGTHFIILPASDLIQPAIEGGRGANNAPELLRMLLGFSNTMIPGAPQPRIKTKFRYHKTDEIFEDLIAENVFWTPEEFQNADHHIHGFFDDYGQFKGSVRIYHEATPDHIIPWLGAKGKKTLCGPFEINFAVVQGEPDSTRIPIEEYRLIGEKLQKYGGLYIYRDNIRILPYGDSNYDFLDIEKNRTKSAYYYYFSYRRIFGVINISKKQNPNLIEKAGREGFIENKAYRQFKEILKSLFVQLAADYFRDESSGPKSKYWSSTREELKKIYKIRQEKEKRVSVKRKKFKDDLESFFNSIQNGEPQRDVQNLLEEIEREFILAARQRDEHE